jgi:hypothetical protein
MSKIKQLIQQLSSADYEAIYYSLLESNAEKSAYLLQSIRSRQAEDEVVREELEMNQNAYYTLRSRLYQKIEEFLLARMESPRSDLLKKVATIYETVFTKRKAITVTTLKRLERELLEYDLSNELIVVYKVLKKLHAGTDEYFNYSRAYNEHVAFTLAVDKAEDLLVNYFRKFGSYFLSDSEEDLQALEYLRNEMNSICQMYKSHRLFVYESCLEIFHRIVVEKDQDPDDKYTPVEEIIDKLEYTFNLYNTDPIYFHLEILIDYYRLLYFQNYRVYKKFERFYQEINERLEQFLNSFSLYTFPSIFLIVKIEKHIRQDTQNILHNESLNLLPLYEADQDDLPNFVVYSVYRAAAAFYGQRYEEAAMFLEKLIEHDKLEDYPYVHVEVRAALVIMLACQRKVKEFNQLLGSVQREVRYMGKYNCKDVFLFLKVVRSVFIEHQDHVGRLQYLYENYREEKNNRQFSPLRCFLLDDKIVDHLLKKIP